MKVTKFPKHLKRKYLRTAATYRRYAGRSRHYDFSMKALLECYDHETHGYPASKMNGYVFGKWMKDVSFIMWREDLLKGDCVKAEFYTPCDRWWAEPALRNLVITERFFPYQ